MGWPGRNDGHRDRLAPFVGSVSVAGTSGDGVITLIIGAVLAALVGTAIARRTISSIAALVIMLGSGLAGFIAFNVMGNVSTMADVEDVGFSSAGVGLWLVVAGAVTAALASLFFLRGTSAQVQKQG